MKCGGDAETLTRESSRHNGEVPLLPRAIMFGAASQACLDLSGRVTLQTPNSDKVITLATPYESARILIELYDLRRETKMREARDWMLLGFQPDSAEEVMTEMRGEHSAQLRMVLSYWEMVASFVNRGAVELAMFHDQGGELLASFCKVELHLDEIRELSGNPTFLAQTFEAAENWAGSKEKMAGMRERFRELAAASPTE